MQVLVSRPKEEEKVLKELLIALMDPVSLLEKNEEIVSKNKMSQANSSTSGVEGEVMALRMFTKEPRENLHTQHKEVKGRGSPCLRPLFQDRNHKGSH